MQSARDWTQHLLIKGLCSPSRAKINSKIIGDIKSEFFTNNIYRKAFRLIREHYDETGTFYTWGEFLQIPELGVSVRRSLRGKEKRRKAYEDDETYNLPDTEEQYITFIERTIYDSKHLRLIELQNELSELLKTDEMTPEKIEEGLELLHSANEDIEQLKINKGELFEVTPENSKSVMKDFYKQLKSNFFIPTGFKAFDQMNLGIPLDSLFIIAAKSGCGKSSMALQYLINAKEQGARCCLLPLEMSKEQMLCRLASNKLQVPVNELTKNLKKYWKKMNQIFIDFCAPKFSDDEGCLHFYTPDVTETLSEALAKLTLGHYNIIAVDYIGLMAQSAKDRWESLANDANYAKRYATKYKTQVLFLAQLDDKTDDIRYSKGLKEAASNMWYWTETAQEVKETHRIMVNQPKARNQDPTPFPLMVDLSCSRFSDWIEDATEEDYKRAKTRKMEEKSLSKGFDNVGSDVPDD